jgi:hypothetical protein
MFFMRTDRVVVLAPEGGIGRTGPFWCWRMRAPISITVETRSLLRSTGKAYGDGLSNSRRLFIEQQGKWQTINLRGHEF